MASEAGASHETRVIAVCNPKGGVGKTLLANELASSLAIDFGAQVLLVDLDPWGNLALTTSFYCPDLTLAQRRLTQRFFPNTFAVL